jgi:hypothetical protein
MNVFDKPRVNEEQTQLQSGQRKQFFSPRLTQYDTLPKLTGFSGDPCDLPGAPPNCGSTNGQ